VRGKSNAEVEFGNNLWIGETRSGFIVDYLLEKEKTSDAKQIEPAIKRLVEEQSLRIKSVCGDRGVHSDAHEEMLKSRGLKEEPEFREGLKRRAGIEARISIVIRKFMSTPARAKGFENREMMVG
jgi:hypothetical protein